MKHNLILRVIAKYLFPVIALLGSLLALAGLNKSSEIVAMRAAGVSRRRFLRSVAVPALMLAATLYAATVYWYLAPGGENPIGPTPVAERHGYYERPPIKAGGFTVTRVPSASAPAASWPRISGAGRRASWPR